MNSTMILLTIFGIVWGLVWGVVCAVIRIQKRHFLKGWSLPVWLLRNALSSFIGYIAAHVIFQLANSVPLVLENSQQFPFVSIVAIVSCIAIEVPLVWLFGDSLWQ